jgi:hypothetical protein
MSTTAKKRPQPRPLSGSAERGGSTREREPEKPAARSPHLRALPGFAKASDGARAAVERAEPGEGGGKRLVVRDPGGRVLFEYVPGATAEARCVVHVPAGDLVLRTDAGSIELDAQDAVRLRARAAIEVEADALRARARAAEADLEEVRLRGRLLESTFSRVRQGVDVLELTAGRVVERAVETYREVAELAQLRAGRIRQVAETTFHIMGDRTLVKALQDVKLKGRKIHLG